MLDIETVDGLPVAVEHSLEVEGRPRLCVGARRAVCLQQMIVEEDVVGQPDVHSLLVVLLVAQDAIELFGIVDEPWPFGRPVAVFVVIVDVSVHTTCPLYAIGDVEMHIAFQSVPVDGDHNLARIKGIDVFAVHFHALHVVGDGVVGRPFARGGVCHVFDGEVDGDIGGVIQCLSVVGDVEQQGAEHVVVGVAHLYFV